MKTIASIVLLLLVMVAISTCSTFKSTAILPTSEEMMVEPTDETTQPPGSTNTLANMGVVVIQGIFDPSGEKLLELKPTHLYAYSSPPIPNQPTGHFLVKVTFVSGEVASVPFDALVADDAGRTQHGFFEVTVPVRSQIDYILITDGMGVKTFARIDASELIPGPV